MRIATDIKSWAVLIYALPFDGHQGFQDHNHARNFTHYLFSQSKAHTVSPDTRYNFVQEREDGEWTQGAFNTDPANMLADFLARRFPKQEAHRVWGNDGFYPLFIIRTPLGTAVSNFCKVDDGILFMEHPLLNYIEAIPNITPESVEADVLGHWQGSTPFVDFETGLTDTQRRDVERILHKALSEGNDRVVLSVSHQDQPESNPIFHIHRLLDLSTPPQ